MISIFSKHRYVAIYLVLIILIYTSSLFLPQGPPSLALPIEKDAQAKAILDALNNMQTLFTTLTSTLFAACGALVVKGSEWIRRPWGQVDKYAFVLILVAGATSYYGLYLSHIATIDMVANGAVDPFSHQLQFALQIQYYGFLIGAVLLGLVIVRLMDAKR